MIITWQIEWMKTFTQTINGFSEVVLTAGWRVIGVDGTFTSSINNTATFPEPTVGGTFTPYADLTQDQVLGWVWQNGVDKTAAEESIAAQIELQKNPPIIQPALPWVS